MRYTGPKVKRARRLGFAFSEKDTRILPKRGFPPGQHGQGRSRLSEYGIQLKEKQKCKFLYGVLEKQFFNYFQKAQHRQGVTGDNLIKLLERRLDSVVFRLGFANSRAHARQMVSHGFFTVNGKKVNIPSYSVKTGDTIAIVESKAKGKLIDTIRDRLKNYKTLDFLDLNSQKLSGKLLSEPTPEQVNNQINMQLIIEHYSRI